MQLTRRQEGDANATITAAYSAPAKGASKVLLSSPWQLNCTEKVAQYDAMRAPTAGGSDDGYCSLMPSAIVYKTRSVSSDVAPP